MMTRGWMRPAAVGLMLVLGTGAAIAWGKPGTVITNDGQTFEGEVTEKGQSVTVMTKGNIPVTINRANVSAIEYAGSVKQQFEQRMAKLGKEDADGRVKLAEWALEKEEFDLALDALDAAIAIDPNNADARRMQRAVLARRSMQRTQAAANAKAQQARAQKQGQAAAAGEAAAADDASDAATADPADAGAAAEGEAQPRPAAARQRGNAPADDAKADQPPAGGRRQEDDRPEKLRTVTPAEINRIRQMELQKGEKVRVNFQNDVKQRYLASSDMKPQEFNKLTPPEQARLILDDGAEGLHRDVMIATDPATMSQFKQNVQRHVLPGCASAACHGGPAAGRFKLHNPANKDVEAYTNFLLLQRFQTTIGGKEYALIDRARPENSLVLLMGLPPRDAAVPHPDVKNFRPAYKGANDRNYQSVLTWIEQALGPVQPEYNIDLAKPAPEDGKDGDRPARGTAAGRGGDRDMQDDAGAARQPPPQPRGAGRQQP